jgi:hypothetical protein
VDLVRLGALGGADLVAGCDELQAGRDGCEVEGTEQRADAECEAAGFSPALQQRLQVVRDRGEPVQSLTATPQIAPAGMLEVLVSEGM